MESGCSDSPDDAGKSATEQRRTDSAPRSWTAPLVVAWLLVIAVGSAWMVRYQRTPGPRGSGAAWPVGTGLDRTDGQTALIMFVHPRCPCSHASVVELERLVRSSGTTLQPRFVFFAPPGADSSWARTDLWARALRIPSAECVVDRGGAEHRRFGARTSGETFLFGKDGALRFQGGITAGRGEEGDNSARAALARLLEIDAALAPPMVARTPVFGCPLEGSLTSPPCCAAAAQRQGLK